MIVGQGIAGSLLAYELLERGATVDILNQTDRTASSYVAAGLYNPVTGRKMIKTWNADKVFPILEPYYSKLERILNAKFLYPTKIYRPFMALEEQNEWQGRIADGHYDAFIEDLKTTSIDNAAIKDPHGGLLLKNAGYVDVGTLLEAFRDYFTGRDSYQEVVVDVNELSIQNGVVNWNVKEYGHIVFCEGAAVRNNPFFNWLPLKPVKGEILDIEVPYDESFVLNRGVFMLPVDGNQTARLGSTYDNHHLNLEPTTEAIAYLRTKLEMIFEGAFKIVGHRAGIRPATKDRKPFNGTHPAIKEMSIFNGFGTKGVSLAVYYAQQFADHLIGNNLIDDDVNITRFHSLYPN